MTIPDFRPAMALCNIINIIFLIRGFILIKKQNQELHKNMMIFSIYTSIFLVIFYSLQIYFHGPLKHINPEGLFKFILSTHLFFATIIPILVFVTAYLAIKNHINSHKKIVKLTLPIWLYVSITGIIIYLR